ncbi:MAG TPA: hypothetical protein VMB49_11255 [Acidobacteriaceae bacterium]|nr:hypothetical protein [Acidobacteriaceae bacterium]
MSAGIREQDARIFFDAAKNFNVWLVLRQTNRESLKYIGLSRYFPKPITCKAKTADYDPAPGTAATRIRYTTAGLVVDPTVHRNVFSGGKTATQVVALWTNFKSEYLNSKGSDYSIDRDAASVHFGCVQYKGRYLHSDYDLYDIIVVGHERANLALVGERDGAPDFRPPRLAALERFINSRIGSQMIQHGGQFQFSEHTNDTVEVFGPKGESFVGPAAPWYAKHFPHRRAPGPLGGFAAMQHKA